MLTAIMASSSSLYLEMLCINNWGRLGVAPKLLLGIAVDTAVSLVTFGIWGDVLKTIAVFLALFIWDVALTLSRPRKR